jgi:hypothetical protein
MRLPIIASAALLSVTLLSGCGHKDVDAELAAHNCTKAGKTGAGLFNTTYTVYRDCAGDVAPVAEFDGPDGKKVSFAQFAGKPFIVNVWSMNSLDSANMRSQLHAIALENKMPIVAINNSLMDTDTQSVTRYIKAGQLALKDYRSKNAALIAALHGNVVPTTILYNSEGKMVWLIRGGAVDFLSPEGAALLKEAQ